MQNTQFAGFGVRFGAFLIDAVIVSAMVWIAGFIVGFAYGSLVQQPQYLGQIGTVIAIVLAWLYSAGFESSRSGATLGKRLAGIRVTDLTGKRISFGRASLRFVAKIIAIAPVGLGFLVILFNKHRRGLHDLLARTLVLQNKYVK